MEAKLQKNLKRGNYIDDDDDIYIYTHTQICKDGLISL